jgi:signal transduction histidine kinase
MDVLNNGKLHKISNDTGSAIEEERNRNGFITSGRLSGINIYAIGLKRNDRIYGGIIIFVQSIFGEGDLNIIETISNQVSLSLQRKTIEKDLKSSEYKYRKLNRELETKVKERTHDLETLNYQLNQELIERHLAEEALKKSEGRLKELNATKDKFFNIIAHDLKNPFTCLLGATELLNENIRQMDTEQIKELVHLLNDSAKSGYAILQNLLDWSRSQTGLITLNPERIELKSMIDEHLSDLYLNSVKKDIELRSEVEKEMFVIADKNMINTILRNLLANAIKFTPRFGYVTVCAVIKKNIATISVKDTGIGITEDNIKKLFRIDIKYNRPGTNKEQGTGLGLILCKEFAELQGGKIWVESIINKGSEFIFSIPVKAG